MGEGRAELHAAGGHVVPLEAKGRTGGVAFVAWVSIVCGAVILLFAAGLLWAISVDPSTGPGPVMVVAGIGLLLVGLGVLLLRLRRAKLAILTVADGEIAVEHSGILRERWTIPRSAVAVLFSMPLQRPKIRRSAAFVVDSSRSHIGDAWKQERVHGFLARTKDTEVARAALAGWGVVDELRLDDVTRIPAPEQRITLRHLAGAAFGLFTLVQVARALASATSGN